MSKTLNTKRQRELDAAISVLRQNPQLAIMLGTNRDGMVLVEFASEMAKVLHAVRRSAKKGSVTLKFDFIPTKGDSSQVHVVDDIKASIPRPDVASRTMFIGHDNLPESTDPAQGELNELDDEERPVAKVID